MIRRRRRAHLVLWLLLAPLMLAAVVGAVTLRPRPPVAAPAELPR